MILNNKESALTSLARKMINSDESEIRQDGLILKRVNQELGSYLVYSFYMRKPCYLDRNITFVKMLIEGYDGGCKNSLTMMLVLWLRKNVPHKNFSEMRSVHVWCDVKPEESKIHLYEVHSNKNYSFAVGMIDNLYRLYVWKN